jgi:hypothetical protein
MALIEQEPEIDTLAHLEDRIQKAVALVTRLRQEKDAALRELADVQAQNLKVTRDFENEIESQRAELASRQTEIESLRGERQQVRARLERLLDNIDQLGAA